MPFALCVLQPGVPPSLLTILLPPPAHCAPARADPSLVVRGKWAHGRTFTSLLADFIILSLLAAYGIATNIAKTCLGHAVFFGAYGERSARVAWG